MIKKVSISLLLMLFCINLKAQLYTEEKTQHRFAQTYFGFNTLYSPSAGNIQIAEQDYKFPSVISPRLTLGGLHFWGKWDFNMNVPLYFFYKNQEVPNSNIQLKWGADLSARYYPWRILFNKFRPYVGASLNQMIMDVEREDEGERADWFLTSSAIVGTSYAFNNWQINAELLMQAANDRSFYFSRTDNAKVDIPITSFSIGIIRYFDVTIKNEKDKISGVSKEREKHLIEKKKANSFTIALAPSAGFFMNAPKYHNVERVSLPRHKGNFTWELGLGYQFHEAKTHLGISYRNYTSGVESYGRSDLIKRNSFAIEAWRYLWDFNGFAPYVGPSIGFERWANGEFIGNEQIGDTKRSSMISPGIIFGWDILAAPLETWILRTNLRYYPFQKITDVEGKTSRVDQFEFNFIQIVWFPNRTFDNR